MAEFHRRPGEPVYTPEGGPPQTAPPRDVYAAVGEDGVRAMLRDFYAELERSAIRGMFPADMTAAADKSALFFAFLLGGPPLYQERVGPPMMRRRHLPFRIDAAAREVWLACWEPVLAKAPQAYAFPAGRIDAFRGFLRDFSAWMVNAA